MGAAALVDWTAGATRAATTGPEHTATAEAMFGGMCARACVLHTQGAIGAACKETRLNAAVAICRANLRQHARQPRHAVRIYDAPAFLHCFQSYIASQPVN